MMADNPRPILLAKFPSEFIFDDENFDLLSNKF